MLLYVDVRILDLLESQLRSTLGEADCRSAARFLPIYRSFSTIERVKVSLRWTRREKRCMDMMYVHSYDVGCVVTASTQ